MSVQKSIIAQTYLLDTPSSIKVCSAGFFCPESVTAELCTIAPIYIQADLLKRQSISLSILLALHKKTLCFIRLSYLFDDVIGENTEISSVLFDLSSLFQEANNSIADGAF